MTDRRAHAWGAAIVAVGGLLGATAALWAGRPGTLWRPLVIGLAAYAASGALVLRWGLAVYGPRGALGGVALAAFTPGVLAALGAPPLIAPAGGTTLLGSFAQLAAAYALMRCLLDPTVQWVFVAGLVIAIAPIGAFLHGSSTSIMGGLGLLSLLLVACRTWTVERCEARRRAMHASIVAVGLAWAVALAIALLVAAASHLPSVEEYSAAQPRSAPSRLPKQARTALRQACPEPSRRAQGERKDHFDSRSESVRAEPFDYARDRLVEARGGVFRQAASGAPTVVRVTAPDAAETDPSPPSTPWPAVLPLTALVLAALRPWRRQRRYTDAGWVAALLCLGVFLWLAWGEPGGVFMTPIAALLAGACWDASRPAWARHAAAMVVALQVMAALLLWPHYPGGVRADAWLPMAGFSMGGSAEAP